MKPSLILAALAACAPYASAQLCQPAADVNLESFPLSSVNQPQGVVDGDILYYQGYTLAGGTELFRSDGTDAGTFQVADINPGPKGSRPSNFTVHAGQIFFFADDGVHGAEPWVSDGTTAGTRLIKDVYIGPTSSASFSSFVAMGGYVYCALRDAPTGTEVWKTDGTAAGTSRVTDLAPGAASSYPNGLAVAPSGTHILFAAENSTLGRELFITNGTAGGTLLLKDLNTGTGSSYPHSFVALDNRMLFAAAHPTSGDELWITNGTPAGTLPLKDINPGSGGSFPGLNDSVLFQGERYFAATTLSQGSEVWKTDGSPAGTVLVADLAPGSGSSQPKEFTDLGTDLYFVASINFERVLMRLNGLTQALGPVVPAGTGPIRPKSLATSNGLLYFNGFTDGSGEELWTSDGTAIGTQLVIDLEPGPDYAFLTDVLARASGGVYFAAQTSALGREMFISNGSAAGTHVVADVLPGVATRDADPNQLTSIGGKELYFAADNGVIGFEPYRWTAATGAVLLKDIYPGNSGSQPADSDPAGFTQAMIGGKAVVFFVADTNNEGRELWVTEGTPASTKLVKNIATVWADSNIAEMTPAFGKLIFVASTPNDRELWVSDGTAAGTNMLVDLVPGNLSSDPKELTRLGNQILFQAKNASGDVELYITDGTATGTQLLMDIGSGYSSTPHQLTRVGDHVAFIVYRDASKTGTDLWKTDGTVAGTQFVSGVDAAAYAGPQKHMVAWGDTLLFNAQSLTSKGLWQSDLTTAGTSELFTFANAEIKQITPVGNRVFFECQASLFVTTSTPASAINLTTNIAAGSPAYPGSITPFDQGVAFTVNFSNLVYAKELYYSNGTVPGTAIVCDVTPEYGSGLSPVPTGSEPAELTWVNGDLFYVASAPSSVGREVFRSIQPGGYVQDLGLSGAGHQITANPALLGGQVTFRGSNAPAGTSYFGFGPSVAAPSAGLVLSGHAAWLNPAASQVATITTTPNWTYTIPVPSNPAFVGVQFNFQSWTLNGGFPASTSNGLQFVVGQ